MYWELLVFDTGCTVLSGVHIDSAVIHTDRISSNLRGCIVESKYLKMYSQFD